MKTWVHEEIFKGFSFTDDCDEFLKKDEVPDELIERHRKLMEEFRAVMVELGKYCA